MQRRLAVGMLLILCAGTHGEPAPSTKVESSIADLLREIKSGDAAKAEAAAKALSQQPGSSLAEVYAVSEQSQFSAAEGKRLESAIIAIHKRAATDRKKHEEEIGKSWQFATGVETYKASGRRDPKWDKLAIGALTQNARVPNEDSFVLFKAAVDAGCNDPLILYYYGLKGSLSERLPEPQVVEALGKSLEYYGKSSYSPCRKLFALARFASWRLMDTQKLPQRDADLIRSNLTDALDLLHKLPDEHANEDDLIDIGEGLVKAYSWSLKNQKAAFDKVFGALREADPNSASPFAFAAQWYTEWAWEARGGGYADTVTEQGWKLFGERLKIGADFARQAWKTDPTNRWGPTLMLTICMGQGADRAEMEMWFARAMLADPDNVRACNAKSTFLLPKWGGSEEDFRSFGRQCIDAGTARNGIPLVIVNAYLESANRDLDLLEDPEIWQDIKDAYEKVLRDKTRLQDDRARYLTQRAAYLLWACKLKQWEDMLRLSKEFGEEIDMKTFGTKALYDYYKRKAAKELAKGPI